MFDLTTRVLIVDDMMTMRKLVMKSLKEIGFTGFIEAADGRLAWESLTNASPAIGLIISDWNMPNATGIDLLKRVRAESKYKHIPFLLVTAEAEKTQVAEALQAGVSNYVVKPFTTDILKEKLETAHKKITGG
jgi:two-component system chemotaxis response regulator CheY